MSRTLTDRRLLMARLDIRRPGAAWLDISRLSLRQWVIGFAGLIAVVIVSYHWIDRPVARLMNQTLVYIPFWHKLTRIPDLLTLASIAVLVSFPVAAWSAGGVRRLANSQAAAGVMLAISSFALSTAIKIVLKWSFGRAWPETWTGNNPSFIRDGVYGFFPFHGGNGFAAFPSGHMTAVVSVAVIGWQLWPRLAPFWLFAVAGAGLGLVGLDFHFVSDVIAGAYLGAACAALVLWLARLRASARW